MPLIARTVAAYAAALLLGFGGVSVWWAAAAAFTALGLYVAGRREVASLAVVAAAGLLVARAAERRAAACDAALVRAGSVTAVLDDAAGPGAFVSGRVAGDGCGGVVHAGIERGVAPAGGRVVLRGVIIPTARGPLVQRAAIVRAPGGSALVAARARAGLEIDSLFGADRGLARALLVADARAIPTEVRDRFADAGLVHVLSVSGLHVAIVAGVMELLLVAARVPRPLASVGAVVATIGYVALLGAPPAAVRSGVMLTAALAARRAQRPVSPWAALALGAGAPLLLDARTVTDLGYQLSVAGMASLVASGAAARRWLAPRMDGWRRKLGTELLASTLATTVTAPLVAWSFGRVSVVAPLTNLAASPIVAVMQPTLFLALALAPLGASGRFVAAAAHPMLVALDGVATLGARVPGAAIPVAPTWVEAAWWAAAAASVLWLCVARDRGPALLSAAACAAGALWTPAADSVHASGDVELHVIDVGQGDAVALRTPAGRWLLFDAGRIWQGGDAGRATVVPYLRRRGGTLAAFVLSHPHADHVGGAASVVAALRPGAYWDAAFAGGGDGYRASLVAADRAGTAWHRVHPGDSVVVDGVVTRFLAPDSAWTAALRDPNDASTVALVRYGAVRFLLVGDAERGEEEWLLAHESDELRADVLKVGHHGSSTSSTAAFIDAVRPRVAVVSVGAGNSYGHPSPDVLARLAAAGAEVLRTDVAGSIVVRTDGTSITIDAGEMQWTLPHESPAP